MSKRQGFQEIMSTAVARLEMAAHDSARREELLLRENASLRGKLLAHERHGSKEIDVTEKLTPEQKAAKPNTQTAANRQKELDREYSSGVRDGRTAMLRGFLRFASIPEMHWFTHVVNRTKPGGDRGPEQLEMQNKILAETYKWMEDVGLNTAGNWADHQLPEEGA